MAVINPKPSTQALKKMEGGGDGLRTNQSPRLSTRTDTYDEQF